MKFENEDIAKFIEIVTDYKNVVVHDIKKEIVYFKHSVKRNGFTKINLHNLVVEALILLSKKYKVIIKNSNGISIFRINKFRFEARIKDWNSSVIFITLLKLK